MFGKFVGKVLAVPFRLTNVVVRGAENVLTGDDDKTASDSVESIAKTIENTTAYVFGDED